VNVLELGESKHAHPKAIKPSAITCLWPHLQVSWVHLTNMSTEVFMGHAAALQEVRYCLKTSMWVIRKSAWSTSFKFIKQ